MPVGYSVDPALVSLLDCHRCRLEQFIAQEHEQVLSSLMTHMDDGLPPIPQALIRVGSGQAQVGLEAHIKGQVKRTSDLSYSNGDVTPQAAIDQTAKALPCNDLHSSGATSEPHQLLSNACLAKSQSPIADAAEVPPCNGRSCSPSGARTEPSPLFSNKVLAKSASAISHAAEVPPWKSQTFDFSGASLQPSRLFSNPFLAKSQTSISEADVPCRIGKNVRDSGSLCNTLLAKSHQHDLATTRRQNIIHGDFWGGAHFAVRLVKHPCFEYMAFGVILASTIHASFFIDLAIRTSGEVPVAHIILQASFLTAFVIELLLRLSAHGPNGFFFSTSKWGRMIDIVVIITGVVDFAISLHANHMRARSMNITILRIARVVRLLRIARVGYMFGYVDLFFFRSSRARLLLHLFEDSVKSFVLITVVLVIIIYTFAVIITSGVSDYIRQEYDNHDYSSVLLYWGSTRLAINSLLMAVTGGLDWHAMALPIWDEIGASYYYTFILYVVFFKFVVVNCIASTYIQTTLQLMGGPIEKGLQIRKRLEEKEYYINRLEKIFGLELEEDEFLQYLEEEGEARQVMDEFAEHLGLTQVDIETIFSSFSENGCRDVNLRAFVVGCIEIQSASSRLDIIQIDAAQRQRIENQILAPRESVITLDSSTTLKSIEGKPLLDKHITNVSLDELACQVVAACKQHQLFKFSQSRQSTYLDSIHRLVDLVAQCKGGCGFIISHGEGYHAMKMQRIDFQVVDRNPSFPKGFMTEQTKGYSLEDQHFAELMIKFTDHEFQINDKWPGGHEAAGLPKDGFNLISINGTCRSGATRLAGLPTPPFTWNGVGTRHLAALSAAWALVGQSAVVIVRSDSGKIHVFVPHHSAEVTVFCVQALYPVEEDI